VEPSAYVRRKCGQCRWHGLGKVPRTLASTEHEELYGATLLGPCVGSPCCFNHR
jgi:hypothetical protein